MNIKRQATIILLLAVSLVIIGCVPGQLLGPTPTPKPTLTPTTDPSLCPGVYLEKFLAASNADIKGEIKTELAANGSVNASTYTNEGGVMYMASMFVYDHALTSAALNQAQLDVPKIGDGSVAFTHAPLMNVGGNVTVIQFFRGSVLVQISGVDLVNLNSVPVGNILTLAQAIDQALPPTGLPMQLDCVPH
jgi:hypothetical protein